MEVSRREIYRYLGIRGQDPDEGTREKVERAVRELTERITPRFICRDFPLSITGEDLVDLTCFSVRSRALAKNLAGCERAVLFAATLGEGPDFLIRRYSRLEMSMAVVCQAASAAMIEAYCDELNESWRTEWAEKGFALRPRFSPGYGDLPLTCQTEFCDALKTGKTAGITLTDTLLMMPSKSVTAIIGLYRRGDEVAGGAADGAKSSAGTGGSADGAKSSAGTGGGTDVLRSCAACGATDCAYRRTT